MLHIIEIKPKAATIVGAFPENKIDIKTPINNINMDIIYIIIESFIPSVSSCFTYIYLILLFLTITLISKIRKKLMLMKTNLQTMCFILLF